jgi:hypothetical protein
VYLYLVNKGKDSSSNVFLRELTSFIEQRSGGAGSTELYGLELLEKTFEKIPCLLTASLHKIGEEFLLKEAKEV